MILAEYFLGKPYIAFALSPENPERVYISLEDFDCVTFIENVMSLYASKGQDSLYKKNLIYWRYSNPNDIRFETREHYFTSALRRMVTEKRLEQVHSPVEVNSKKTFSFLSNFYRSKNKNISIPELQHMEQKLAGQSISYFPTAQVTGILPWLRDGDIITFVSRRNNLDVQHTGFLVQKKKNWYLLHASQEAKKVCISEKNLTDYLKSHPSFLGFQVFRPNFIK